MCSFLLFSSVDNIAGSCLSPPKATVWSVKLLSLYVLLGRLDFSSLLTSDQKRHKKAFTPPCFAASCVDMIWSNNPDRVTSTEEQGAQCAIIVTTAVIYQFKQQVDQQGQRVGTNLLCRLYTICWHSEHKTLTLIFASNPVSSKVNRWWRQR